MAAALRVAACNLRFLQSDSVQTVFRGTKKSMASNEPKRRSRTLVDPEVQGSLLRKIALQWGLLFIANTLGLMIWLRMFEQPEVGWGETFADCLRRFLPFFVISIAFIPAFMWDTLKATNRFAGPMMRLRAALAEASRGRTVKPLNFRGNDFWQEAADHFNALIEHRSKTTPLGRNSDSNSTPHS